jgi:hypothetical protein
MKAKEKSFLTVYNGICSAVTFVMICVCVKYMIIKSKDVFKIAKIVF